MMLGDDSTRSTPVVGAAPGFGGGVSIPPADHTNARGRSSRAGRRWSTRGPVRCRGGRGCGQSRPPCSLGTSGALTCETGQIVPIQCPLWVVLKAISLNPGVPMVF
jgi:hypothetical protein